MKNPAALIAVYGVVIGVGGRAVVGMVGSLLGRQVHLGRLGGISTSGTSSAHRLVVDPRKADIPQVDLGGVADGGQDVARRRTTIGIIGRLDGKHRARVQRRRLALVDVGVAVPQYLGGFDLHFFV